MRWVVAALIISLIVACSSYKDLPVSEARPTDWKTRVIPPTPQPQDGDPAAGFRYIAEGDYVGSGIPVEFFEKKIDRVPDTVLHRQGLNADIAYGATIFVDDNGVELFSGNCFSCHASEFNGEVIIGLGNSFSDYRSNFKPLTVLLSYGMGLKYKLQDPEYQSFQDFGRFSKAMAPYIQLNQPGVNPAFRLAEGCVRQRNPEDLTYTKEAQFEIDDYPVATDVPPLWNVGKKNSLYYTGGGQGDFRKLLFQASYLGIRDSAEARKAFDSFRDVYAWLAQLEPPRYPKPIDQSLAIRGKALFEEHCSGCHGTYGEEETYPNKVVSLNVVKTDPAYAHYAANSGIYEWFNNSWFGQSEPKAYFEIIYGYIAPPLDGVWATAPYLHNGSVPTLEDLLNSSQRPLKWTRSGKPDDYDWEKMGWKYRTDVEDDWTYDTTLPAYSNKGHYFGDKLNSEERRSVIEYLKTL